MSLCHINTNTSHDKVFAHKGYYHHFMLSPKILLLTAFVMVLLCTNTYAQENVAKSETAAPSKIQKKEATSQNTQQVKKNEPNPSIVKLQQQISPTPPPTSLLPGTTANDLAEAAQKDLAKLMSEGPCPCNPEI